MPPRKPNKARYEFCEGVRQACLAIAARMDEGEDLQEALEEDFDDLAHPEMTKARREGFFSVFRSIGEEVARSGFELGQG